MTLERHNVGRGLQLAGMLAAVLGIGATLIAPFCEATIWAGAGALGAGLDLASLAMRPSLAIIALSLLKGVIVISPMFVLVMCAFVRVPPPPIPVDVGPTLILTSVVPSIVGAVPVRSAR